MKETFARISVLATLAMVPALILWYQNVHIPSRDHRDTKVFTLTAVGAGSGAYTLEKVHGLNYWWKKFDPATIFLQVGDRAIVRLQSADVTHRFYIPALNIGPVNVKAGHTSEVLIEALQAGLFQYFCTTICGPCHFYMTGWIVISGPGKPVPTPKPITCPMCFGDLDAPRPRDLVALGEFLFVNLGCITCHGVEAAGGVKNYNYAKETIPAHNSTVEKLFLRSREDTETFMGILKKGIDLTDLEEPPDIALAKVVIDRCEALKNIIRNGSRPQKLALDGPEPPHWMPAWQYHLSDRDIHGLISYFISLYSWEESEET